MAEDLRVIIATAGRPRLLQRTLDSLAACERPPIYRETIVVENGPPMGTREIVEACPKELAARYVHVERANKSNALNVAMQNVPDSCLIFFSDDDVRFAPDVLMRYCEAARDRTSGLFYGGPIEVDYEQAPPTWLRPHLPASAVGWRFDATKIHEHSVVFLGFNWAAFAGDIRTQGEFDPRFGPGGTSGGVGQESEMQQRLVRADIMPQYVPEALVWHYVPAERCTPKWALKRLFRAGLRQGLLSERHALGLLGFLRWRARRLLKPALWYLGTRITWSPATRFAAKARLWYVSGIVWGAWTTRNRLCREKTQCKETGTATNSFSRDRSVSEDSLQSSGSHRKI